MKTLAPAVRDYFEEKRPELVEFLRRLVVAESPSLLPESQKQVFDRLAEALDTAGYCSRRIPGKLTGGQLYARPVNRTKNSPSQLLIGHTDTVWPVGMIQKMPVEIDGQIMKGPGVYDMKAGLAQIVYALKALNDLKIQPAVTPVLFINSDEELGSEESERYIEFLSKHMDRAFILEPATGREGRLKTARKGVGEFKISIEGRSAHAGVEPEQGVSAILELSHVIQKLSKLNDPEVGVTVNVGVVEGGMRANMIAPESRAIVDVRVPTALEARRIEKAIYSLEAVNPEAHLKIEGSVARLPMERTPANQALWQLAREKGCELGLDLEESTSGGGSDGNITSLFTATLDGLGAVGGGAHALHEFIFLDKLIERAALLTLLLASPPLKPRAELDQTSSRAVSG